MILEEITGDVTISLKGQTLSLGSTIEDQDYPLVSIVGNGKATFRVDPSCTVEIKAVELVVEEPAQATPVEITLTTESTVNTVEAPVKITVKEAPATK